ncbi:MAG: FAD-dependent thymidylate synthase [Candidatus Omnitrophota bacterium]
MSQTKLNLKLLDFSPNALAIIYAACRQCYSADFAGDIFEAGKEDLAKREEFVRKIVSSGHKSPLEHVKFTFAIEGVSRALTHQLVRHRIASYSQQSQRYVKAADFEYIVPPAFEADAALKETFITTMMGIQESYNKLLVLLADKGKKGERANEDARFVLPQACETKIVVTMNCRELIHFFNHRCCARAQWEIRALASEMLAVCKKELPAVFADGGPKCEALKYCPEGEKFSCGRYPARKQVL